MKIKVCGMKYPDNIKEVNQLPIDMMGFVFYDKSPRYIDNLSPDVMKTINPEIRRTGVFVDASIEKIQEAVYRYSLDIVQLHGNESPEFCQSLKQNDIKLIKAFSIEVPEDFNPTKLYENQIDYFLFDTKTAQYGGSGRKFDWEILSFYQGNIPFILSGGINESDTDRIKNIKHPAFAGIDLNSRFELSPGLKDIKKLNKFVQHIK
ncbi:MAG: phosphoribosylanthranilate isomerase [Dysgonamonadaceae bacterium]|jgi:phosphoribosylanthranilate isomerase|nr:phosphoribosylanthranilate isomerase [Dysgonamonadaceae bacterium]